MPLPKIKIAIFFILLFLFSAFFISIMTIKVFDQNSFLNLIENKIVSLLNKDKIIDEPNNYILKIKDKIPSSDFLNTLYFFKNSDNNSVIYDMGINILSDYENIGSIKKVIGKNDNLYGILKIANKKGLSFKGARFSRNDDLWKNFTYIKSDYPFVYSSYLNDIEIKNELNIPSKNIGFITKKNMTFDKNNIDILYKFDNKFLLSVPFIVYINKKELDINKLNFSLLRIRSDNGELYYDQKGKMGFLHNILNNNDILDYDFTDWQNALNARKGAINKLINLGLFKSDAADFELYKEQEEILNSIYNFLELPDQDNNTILNMAKNDASLWNGFKKSTNELLNNANIFITLPRTTDWVYNFVYEYKILNAGKNLIRFPILAILCFSILLLICSFFAYYFIKQALFPILISITLFILNFTAYFGLRIFLNTDFPLLSLSITIFLGAFGGLILKFVTSFIWFNEIKAIYKGSVSNSFAQKIANFWKANDWSLESRSYNCSFMHIDTSALLQHEITEEDVEFIGIKNSEIESIIKKNEGVRNSFTPTQVLCYFGNPPIYKDHAPRAVRTAFKIQELSTSKGSLNNDFKIAIHSKEEWFRYIKKENQRMYTYFGNTIIILMAMIKYAKKFNISIIISDTIYKLCTLKTPVRMLDRIRIEGIRETVRLFELVTENEYQDNYEFYDFFHAGLKLFENQKWKEASAYFRQCLKIKEDDNPAKIFMERCKEFSYVPPTEGWDGTYEIDKEK